MAIVVTVLEYPEGSRLLESSMTFTEQGGTLGRTQNNTWVLEDPDRFLSGSHCQIVFDSGAYFLVDTSTNGTFVNGSGEPLGKGNRVKLEDGYQFELSDYKFKVQLLPTTQLDSNFGALESQPKLLDSDDPFAAPVSASLPISNPAPIIPALSDPFATAAEDFSISGLDEEVDPLAALNKSSQAFGEETNQSDPFAKSYSDNANFSNQAVDWPKAAPAEGLIPENWDDDLLQAEPIQSPNVHKPEAVEEIKQPVAVAETLLQSSSGEQPKPPSISVSESEARRRALEKENRRIKAENEKLKKQIMSLKKRATSSTGQDTTLVEAIGFNIDNLEQAKIAEINEISGEFIRKVVEGMMQTLASRNNVKNAFRMNMTTIQPVENNPLKFSANVDDALDNMFIKEGNSYKKPIETVQESFESIADHQVAILAGIRSAFEGVVTRFKPSTLEARFEKQNKRGLLPRNEKAKYWDAFNDYYTELFSDIDNSFQYLFGDEFSQAYEEQLQALSQTRKTNT